MTALSAWCAALCVLTLATGAVGLAAPQTARRALSAFPRSKTAGCILAAIAWAGAAREISRMEIDVFDTILNRFPAEPWLLAAALCVLCILFMPDLLPIRALSGILMLFPTPFFACTRLAADGPARIAAVSFAYVCLTAGMFFMFYPWHARRIMAWIAAGDRRVRAASLPFLAAGTMFAVLAFVWRNPA